MIYYTLDGSLPTQSSTPYTGPVPLASAGVLRAAAFTNGWTPSVAAVAYYGPPAVSRQRASDAEREWQFIGRAGGDVQCDARNQYKLSSP